MLNMIAQLQEWYAAQCNGDWEHTYGIKIETVDNPGWTVEIDISDTDFEGASFDPIESNMDHPDEWMRCKLDRRTSPSRFVFHGAGGPAKLNDILTIFVEWTRQVDARAR